MHCICNRLTDLKKKSSALFTSWNSDSSIGRSPKGCWFDPRERLYFSMTINWSQTLSLMVICLSPLIQKNHMGLVVIYLRKNWWSLVSHPGKLVKCTVATEIRPVKCWNSGINIKQTNITYWFLMQNEQNLAYSYNV